MTPELLAVLVSAVSAWLVCALMLPVVRRHATRTVITSAVAPDRAGRTPVPLLGGVAVMAGAVVGIALALRLLAPGVPELLHAWQWITVCLCLSCVGLIDDVAPLRVLPRLAVELVLAVLLVLVIAPPAITGVGPVDLALTVTAFILLVNSVNIMDNSDLALTLPMIAIMATATLCLLAGAHVVSAIVAAATAGTLCAFVPWNAPPARLYLGDAGSLPVGAVLAGLSLVLLSEPPTATGSIATSSGLASLLVVAGLLLVPVIDTTVVAGSRIAHGRSVAAGGVDHVSHRLVRAFAGTGHGPARAAIVLASIASAAGMTSVALAWSLISPLTAASVLTTLGVGAVAWSWSQPHDASPVAVPELATS